MLEDSKAFIHNLVVGSTEACMRMADNPKDSFAALDTSSDGAQDVLEVQIVLEVQDVLGVRDVQGIKGNWGKTLASCNACFACFGNHKTLEAVEIYLGDKDCSTLEEDTCLDIHEDHTRKSRSRAFLNRIQEGHGVQCLD